MPGQTQMENLNRNIKSQRLKSKIIFLLFLRPRRSNLPPAIQVYINKLLQQIDDLQVYLEEEKYNHKNTKLQVKLKSFYN